MPPKPSLLRRIAFRCIVAVFPIGLLMWALVQPRYSCHGGSKVDIARAIVKKYAFEAYPEWSATNPSRACPTTLAELNPWMNNKDVRDPWGGAYLMRCDANGFGVYSPGEDGIYGSADDILSWE